MDAAEELPQLPGLSDLWTRDPDLNDREGLERLVEELKKAEQQLSSYRSGLLERINAATSELVSRYKSDPSKCLDLLPAEAR